ncbi:hypothetical protein ACFWN1_31455 [Streptomyces sp. NPDC058459]|uniref:hypothetical protein n=1 Tax=Streptomyces sp. NPDC058459 TaxID=3346508 RepID=UPI003650466C
MRTGPRPVYVYLHKATSTGGLSARVKIASRWTGHKKIVGAGDLDGDGRGDLLVRNKSYELWRYGGTPAGTFEGRIATGRQGYRGLF